MLAFVLLNGICCHRRIRRFYFFLFFGSLSLCFLSTTVDFPLSIQEAVQRIPIEFWAVPSPRRRLRYSDIMIRWEKNGSGERSRKWMWHFLVSPSRSLSLWLSPHARFIANFIFLLLFLASSVTPFTGISVMSFRHMCCIIFMCISMSCLLWRNSSFIYVCVHFFSITLLQSPSPPSPCCFLGGGFPFLFCRPKQFMSANKMKSLPFYNVPCAHHCHCNGSSHTGNNLVFAVYGCARALSKYNSSISSVCAQQNNNQKYVVRWSHAINW